MTREDCILLYLDRTCDVSEANPCFLRSDATESTEKVTYADLKILLRQHLAFLQQLLHNFTTCTDVVIAYLSPNTPDLIVSALSCTDSRLDATPALLNVRWTPQEMANALQSTKPASSVTILLHDVVYQPQAAAAARLLRHRCVLNTIPALSRAFFKPLTAHRAASGSSLDINHHMEYLVKQVTSPDALIVFTSGTTSGAKGVRLSHRALCVQAFAKLQPPCSYSSENVLLASTLPFFHVGGLSSVLAVLLAGGSLVLPPSSSNNLSFDPSLVVRLSSTHYYPINLLVVVPTMLESLRQQGSQPMPNVRLVLVGGQSASPYLLTFARAAFPNARLVQTYACSEAASSITFQDVTRRTAFDASSGDCVGRPPPHVQVELRHRPDLDMDMGVLVTRGPHIMNGYWKRGAPTRKVVRVGDWFETTDVCRRDGDLFYFCGRITDTIRTGGETVHASEVERVLAKHPRVIACAVFGLADARFGETVSCAVVLREKADLSLKDVREWCAEQGLAGYKRPRRVIRLRTLPRTSSGKVLKRLLKEYATSEGQSKSTSRL